MGIKYFDMQCYEVKSKTSAEGRKWQFTLQTLDPWQKRNILITGGRCEKNLNKNHTIWQLLTKPHPVATKNKYQFYSKNLIFKKKNHVKILEL